MASKRVSIGYLEGTKLKTIQLVNATGVKESEETSASTTLTFDGVVPQGTSDNPFSLEISRISYEDKATYQEIRDIINKLRTVPGVITVSEDIYPRGSTPFTIIRDYSDAIVDGKDYEIKPEEKTVYNMKFKAGAMKETIVDITS